MYLTFLFQENKRNIYDIYHASWIKERKYKCFFTKKSDEIH